MKDKNVEWPLWFLKKCWGKTRRGGICKFFSSFSPFLEYPVSKLISWKYSVPTTLLLHLAWWLIAVEFCLGLSNTQCVYLGTDNYVFLIFFTPAFMVQNQLFLHLIFSKSIMVNGKFYNTSLTALGHSLTVFKIRNDCQWTPKWRMGSQNKFLIQTILL